MDACPDCPAVAVDGHLDHDSTCPLGLGYDQCRADDRLWFACRPGTTARRRPPHWAEIAELRSHGFIPPVGAVFGDVIVEKVTEFARVKRFGELYVLLAAGR